MKAPPGRSADRVDYRTLADLRYQLRRFLRVREIAARDAGIEPQQYLMLLQIKGLQAREVPTVGILAERLQIHHHSAVQLVNRLAGRGMVERRRARGDRRKVVVSLRPAGERLLNRLAGYSLDELTTEGPQLLSSLKRLVTRSMRGAVSSQDARKERTGHDRTLRVAAGLGVITGALALLSMGAEGQMSTMGPPTASPAAPPPIRTTMSDLHAHGGVPPGWRFLMPPGAPAEGRKLFVAMECFACHEIKGEDFPRQSKTPHSRGPELTGMGSHHPAEYFAESIVNPNRVIVQAPGYTGPDGRSTMPSYADTMTLGQLVDVVAYLKSLHGADTPGPHHDMGHENGGSMKMK